MQRDRVDLVATMVSFIPFDKPDEPMLEEEAWPIITEQLGDTPLDTGDPKANGEWLAHGFACAPDGSLVTEIDVSIGLGKETKTLHVVGDREWVAERGRSISVTDPSPFDKMPINPAKAFGGVDFKDNPAGQGHWQKKGEAENYPLPSIMYAGDKIIEPGDIIPPAYFGPQDVMLPERQRRAGTYDQNWAETSFPGLPDDFDQRFFQAAQADQQIESFFTGSETFHIENMHPDFREQILTLPGIRSRAFITINRSGKEKSFEEIPMATDTVYLFPASAIAVLIHRGRIQVESMDFVEIDSIIGAFEWLKDKKRPVSYYASCRDERDDRETAAQAILKVAELYPERWEEPPEKLADIIKPRDPTLTRDGTNKLDALWGKWKAILDKGLASSGLPPYDQLVASRGGVLDDDAEVGAIRQEIDRLKNNPMPTAKELQDKGMGTTKVANMVNAYMDKQTDAAEAYFRRECAIFGYDFDDLKARAAAASPTTNQGLKSFINAELQRIGADERSPQQVRDAARRASVELVSSSDMLDKLDDLEARGKTFVGHLMPKAPVLVPAANEDVRAEVVECSANGEKMNRKDLRGADLSGLDLSGSIFGQADFTSANLTGANLSNCLLNGACFAFANLTNTVLENVQAEEANFGEAFLNGTKLGFANLQNAVFTKAYGAAGLFLHADLKDAKFIECNMPEAQFLGANCAATLFIETAMPGALFNSAEMNNTTFIDCKINRAQFFSSTGAHLTLIGGDFSDSDFRTAQLESFTICNNPRLDGCNFARAELKLANFRGASLRSAQFSDAVLNQADFSETELNEASFVRALARNSRFHRSNIEYVNFEGTDLMEANFLLAKIDNCDVKDANFFGADFMKTEIGDTNFAEANVGRTRLEGFRFP